MGDNAEGRKENGVTEGSLVKDFDTEGAIVSR